MKRLVRKWRELRYNTKKHRWEWIEISVESKRVLRILLYAYDLGDIQNQIKGWTKQETIMKARGEI